MIEDDDMNYDDDETAADVRREARRDAKRNPIDLEAVVDLAANVSAELDEAESIIAGEIEIYSYGLVSCSVCVPAGMDRELIERQVNKALPTGISTNWRISNEGFNTGEPNPAQCNDDSTKLHYLLNC